MRESMLLSLGLGLLCGCAGGEEARPVPFSGTVVRDSEPVDRGLLTLVPRKASAALKQRETTIEAGAYEFVKENAPSPGEYRVVIDVLDDPYGKSMTADSANLRTEFSMTVHETGAEPTDFVIP